MDGVERATEASRLAAPPNPNSAANIGSRSLATGASASLSSESGAIGGVSLDGKCQVSTSQPTDGGGRGGGGEGGVRVPGDGEVRDGDWSSNVLGAVDLSTPLPPHALPPPPHMEQQQPAFTAGNGVITGKNSALPIGDLLPPPPPALPPSASPISAPPGTDESHRWEERELQQASGTFPLDSTFDVSTTGSGGPRLKAMAAAHEYAMAGRTLSPDPQPSTRNPKP